MHSSPYVHKGNTEYFEQSESEIVNLTLAHLLVSYHISVGYSSIVLYKVLGSFIMKMGCPFYLIETILNSMFPLYLMGYLMWLLLKVLSKEDTETLEYCRTMLKRGECPPLLVKFDSCKG
jgi:hypothetical protein